MLVTAQALRAVRQPVMTRVVVTATVLIVRVVTAGRTCTEYSSSQPSHDSGGLQELPRLASQRGHCVLLARGVLRTILSCQQEENVRRKEHAAKRKAVETGALSADAAGAAKRQRMWWEEEIAHGRRGRDDGAALAEDEVNDAEYYKAEVRSSCFEVFAALLLQRLRADIFASWLHPERIRAVSLLPLTMLTSWWWPCVMTPPDVGVVVTMATWGCFGSSRA